MTVMNGIMIINGLKPLQTLARPRIGREQLRCGVCEEESQVCALQFPNHVEKQKHVLECCPKSQRRRVIDVYQKKGRDCICLNTSPFVHLPK